LTDSVNYAVNIGQSADIKLSVVFVRPVTLLQCDSDTAAAAAADDDDDDFG